MFLGKLPGWHEVKWRKDSCLEDGKDFGIDLSGGFFDAGDYMKFTFPLAFTMNVLSWSLERGRSVTCSKIIQTSFLSFICGQSVSVTPISQRNSWRSVPCLGRTTVPQ